MIFVQVLDPLPLLEHGGFDTIPLSRVVNSKVSSQEVQKTHPSCLLVKESPNPIGNRIPHRTHRRIKSAISRPRVDDAMMKQVVQEALIGRQFFLFWTQVTVKFPQGYQGLMPQDVVQSKSHRPKRTSPLLAYVISRGNNLIGMISSLPSGEQSHQPVLGSSTFPDHHCGSQDFDTPSWSLRHSRM